MQQSWPVRLDLADSFRFVHEPLGLPLQDGAPPTEGDRRTKAAVRARKRAIDQLTSRILLSQGGAYLLAGYRGVGKTTLANLMIAELRSRLKQADEKAGGGTSTRLIHIPLTLARPVAPEKLMCRLIIALKDELDRQGLTRLLPKALQADLLLAARRTVMSLKIENQQTSEVSKAVGASLNSFVTSNLSSKDARSVTEDVTYLAYDDSAAEQDLIRISRALTRPDTFTSQMPWWAVWRKAAPALKLKLVFVLDELDKLDDQDATVNDIICTLKTLLTTSGITFLFIAGKPLYDRYRQDAARGDSVYESIFSMVAYVPVLWTGVDTLCPPLMAEKVDAQKAEDLKAVVWQAFTGYLTYRGRGIPRRILQTFNRHVSFHGDGRAILEFGPEDWRRFQFFADLEAAVEEAQDTLIEPSLLERDFHRIDQSRLGLRYMADLIVARPLAQFSLEDILDQSKTLKARAATGEGSAATMIQGLIDVLCRHNLLERVEDSEATVALDDERVAIETFRIPERRLIELGWDQTEADPEDAAVPADERLGLPERFVLGRILSRGAFATVYEARDTKLQRMVAVKVFPSDLPRESRDQMAHEIKVLPSITHPNLVRFLEGVADAPTPYIITELIEGATLFDILQTVGRIEWPEAVHIVDTLLSTLTFLHTTGIIWGDAKPSNIMITRDGTVKLLDFGNAAFPAQADDEAEDKEPASRIIGTPRYMAPERIRGVNFDGRADLFSVAAILFELVEGIPAFRPVSEEGSDQVAPDSVEGTLKAILEGKRAALTVSDLPAAIHDIIEIGLARHAKDRFESAAEMQSYLPGTSVGEKELAALVAYVRAPSGASAGSDAATVVAVWDKDEDPFAEMHEAELDDADMDDGETEDEMRDESDAQGTIALPGAAPAPTAPPGAPASPDTATRVVITRHIVDEEWSETAEREDDASEDLLKEFPGKWFRVSPKLEKASSPRAIPVSISVESGKTWEQYLIFIGTDPVTLGRDKANDIVLSDTMVSRYHAQLRLDADWMKKHPEDTAHPPLILDVLTAVNGIQVDDAMVFKNTTLTEGSEIVVGDIRLKIQFPEINYRSDGDSKVPAPPSVPKSSSKRIVKVKHEVTRDTKVTE